MDKEKMKLEFKAPVTEFLFFIFLNNTHDAMALPQQVV